MRYKIGDLVVTNAGTKAKIINIVGDNHYEIKSDNGELVAHGHCLSPLSIKKSTKVEIFKEITNEMIELYEKKNHDYGDSFSILFEKRGMDYLIPRLLEKIMRIESVAEKGNLVDESIEDSLRDLCNYSIMALIELYGDRDEVE